MKTLPVFILALLLAAGPAPAAQAPTSGQASRAERTFPAEVELVVVDVVVLDKEGRSLAGLTRDDFTLKEDGALETIDSF